jgi:hypothetical protein
LVVLAEHAVDAVEIGAKGNQLVAIERIAKNNETRMSLLGIERARTAMKPVW